MLLSAASAFKRSRCIVPVSSYYESRQAGGGKQPYFISAAHGAVLAIADFWVQWKDAEIGEAVLICTLGMTAANDYTRRMRDQIG